MGTKYQVNNDGSMTILASTADASSTAAGVLYFNSSTNKLRVSNGTTFDEL